jgi:ABC-type multidrug transport system ATPase subunit
MDSIKRLADHGKTIVTVLHQPSSQIFQMVDMLCLLAHGHLVYYGARIEALDFFASMDRHCPDNYNPSEYYLEQISNEYEEIITVDESSKVSQQQTPISWGDAVDKFQQSKYNTKLEQMIKTEENLGIKRLEKFETDVSYQSNFIRQLKWLLWRSSRSTSRNPIHSSSLLFKSVVPAIILGILYFQLKKTPSLAQLVIQMHLLF